MKKILVSNINKKVLEAQYAVRGKALTTALDLEKQLEKGVDLGFDNIVYCNIGNPQSLGQIPLTFQRHVLSLVLSSDLLEDPKVHEMFKPDVIERAQKIVDSIPGNCGAYSHSKGLEFIRKDVVEFIKERDGGVDWGMENPQENIFLTDGASPGVQMIMNVLTRTCTDAIMIPIPQYPLYSASIALFGGAQVGYYLNEEKGWGLELSELQRALDEAQNRDGLNVRAVAVINPGNPTGQLMDEENMKEVIQFCYDNDLVLLADEVYQENIYTQGKEWSSFRKVLHDMGPEYFDNLQLASFHSISKGFLGECGRRGGYVEFSKGWDKEVLDEMYKVASISLCPNIDGQITCDLMVRPPKEGDASFEQYQEEKQTILDSLARRADKLVKTLNTLEGYSCQESEAAMYCFPTITIPEKAKEAAANYVNEETGKPEPLAADLFYSLELLKSQGVCVVPGSGFKQKEGTFHFRTTFLPQEKDIDSVCERMQKFNEEFMNKYR